MLEHVGDNAKSYTTRYGNVSAASIGAIQRGLLTLEQQGGGKFFGEPALNLDDLIQTDGTGRGVINILAADKLMSLAQALRDAAPVAARRAFRAAAGSRRSRKAEARVLLRRGAPALQRRPAGAAREDRAGGALDPLQGRRRLVRHAEPAGYPRHGARTARQPRAARAARLHAARPESRQVRGDDPAREPEARRGGRDHRARRSAKRSCRCSTTKAARPWSSAPSSSLPARAWGRSAPRNAPRSSRRRR